MEHFMELLNGQIDSEDIKENNHTTENRNVPDKIEVSMLDPETGMRQMKNNESSGYSELSVDMLKTIGPVGTKWLYQVSAKISTENRIPEDWYKGIIMPIYKKGDRKQHGNYRGNHIDVSNIKNL
jgi:hypothetical protein